MKKKDMVKILEATKTISDLKQILSYTKYEKHFSGNLGVKDEKNWFPFVEGLEPQFEVLKKEIKKAQIENTKALADLKLCTHDVRISTNEDNGMYISETHKCVLCNKYISTPRCNNWYENTHAVIIKNNKQDCGDYWYFYEQGMSQSEILDIVIKILDKYKNEDEVNLVQDFANLNLENKNIKIYDSSKNSSKFILIIGGSNINILENGNKLYLTKELNDSSVNFLEYFSNILDTKIVLIDRKETIEKSVFDSYRKKSWIKLISYKYITEVEKELALLTNTPFKIIIDLSDFYTANIFNNRINCERYLLNLREYFPNSDIFELEERKEKTEYMDVCHKIKKILK